MSWYSSGSSDFWNREHRSAAGPVAGTKCVSRRTNASIWSARWPQRLTCSPFRASCIAKAVPQEPAPNTAMVGLAAISHPMVLVFNQCYPGEGHLVLRPIKNVWGILVFNGFGILSFNILSFDILNFSILLFIRVLLHVLLIQSVKVHRCE